jgi:hypothetical protein
LKLSAPETGAAEPSAAPFFLSFQTFLSPSEKKDIDGGFQWRRAMKEKAFQKVNLAGDCLIEQN